jgi:hypothetical protein
LNPSYKTLSDNPIWSRSQIWRAFIGEVMRRKFEYPCNYEGGEYILEAGGVGYYLRLA